MRIKGMRDDEMGNLYQLKVNGAVEGQYFYIGENDLHGVVVGLPNERGYSLVRGTCRQDLRGQYEIC